MARASEDSIAQASREPISGAFDLDQRGRGRAAPMLGALRRDAMNPSDTHDEDVPLIQRLLDNPFLLLFLGVMIPMIVYTLWGVIDILTIPVAK